MELSHGTQWYCLVFRFLPHLPAFTTLARGRTLLSMASLKSLFLLESRMMRSSKEAEVFLHPSPPPLPSPHLSLLMKRPLLTFQTKSTFFSKLPSLTVDWMPFLLSNPKDREERKCGSVHSSSLSFAFHSLSFPAILWDCSRSRADNDHTLEFKCVPSLSPASWVCRH